MAKMEFYSQEEAASKLGVDEAGIKQMVSRGELQPFRDRDKLLFKRQQVDALAARDESMGDSIGLSGGDGALDETGTLGNLSLGETGDLSIAGGDDTGMISLDDSGDTGIIPLSDSGDTGALTLDDSGGTGVLPLADTGLGETGDFSSAGNTSIPLSDTGKSSDGSDIGLSATGLGESGLGLDATGTGTGLEDIGLSEDNSGLDALSAGSGISLKLDDTDTDIPLIGGNDDSMDMDPKEGSSGLGLALDDLGGSAAGADSLNLEDTSVGHEKEDPKQSTGISVFDAGEVDEADPMAATIVTDAGGISDDDDLSLDSVGSGSGLLDLTRESDDTSLGAELLDEIYPTGGSAAGESISDSRMDTAAGSSGVFDGAVTLEASHAGATGTGHGTASDDSAMDTAEGTAIAAAEVMDETVEATETVIEAAPVEKRPTPTGAAGANMVPAEPFDPAWSGFSAGMLMIAFITLVGLMTVMGFAVSGAMCTLVPMLTKDAGTLYTYTGGLLGIGIIFGIIGMVVGPKLAK